MDYVEKLYVCDGKVEGCEKTSCYLDGGPCTHTSNFAHALYKPPSEWQEVLTPRGTVLVELERE